MKFNSLKDWVNKLVEYSLINGVFVIVEGKNDVITLSKLGVKHIYPIKGKRFYDIVEDLEYSKLCILLLDLDKQGEKIFQKLKALLQKEGIPVEISFREYLKKFDIKEIENLKPDLKLLEEV
jgi:5S rRNA maturation endonuclease (ribonuclease M5)